MIVSNGKRILSRVNQYSCLFSVRFSSLPQDVRKPDSSAVSRAKPSKDPFMKNVFIGKVDEEFMQFSTFKTTELPDSLRQFQQEIGNKDEVPLNCYQLVRKFGECGFYELNTSESGDVSVADLLHLYEELKLDPALSTLLDLNSSYIIPTLTNYGSPEQKEKYLAKLLRGEILGALAISEETGGSDPMSLRFVAKEKSNGSFILNGEKCWVTNAPVADFYIVLAHVPLENLKARDNTPVSNVRAFIVDKNNNIQIEKHDLFGLCECETGKIKFSEISVPANGQVGSIESGLKIATLTLNSPKFITLVCILNHLKGLISDVSMHIHSRKYFPRELKECEMVLHKISNITRTIYNFESMLYFTASILDKFDTDTSLESALLQIYGFEHCLNAVSICMELLGGKYYDKNYPYEKLWRDLKGLSLFAPTLQTKMFSALIGLDYAGNKLKETVVKNRNPLNFPGEAFKKFIIAHRFHSDKIKLSLNLYKDFHPSLKDASDQLETSILRLKYIVEFVFSRHGSQVVHRQMDLNRITDIAVDIFSMASVLARASHSYCTGVANCDQEVMLARLECYEASKRVKEHVDFITHVESTFSDSISVDIGNFSLNKKSYILSHPKEHDI